jgi:hypothetical protein
MMGVPPQLAQLGETLERFFAAMQACVEQAKPRQKLARDVLPVRSQLQ